MIVLGIEDKYSHLNKMTPIKFEQIGNKKYKVAVFYESAIEKVDYGKLYECFVIVSEQVMQNGL